MYFVSKPYGEVKQGVLKGKGTLQGRIANPAVMPGNTIRFSVDLDTGMLEWFEMETNRTLMQVKNDRTKTGRWYFGVEMFEPGKLDIMS